MSKTDEAYQIVVGPVKVIGLLVAITSPVWSSAVLFNGLLGRIYGDIPKGVRSVEDFNSYVLTGEIPTHTSESEVDKKASFLKDALSAKNSAGKER